MLNFRARKNLITNPTLNPLSKAMGFFMPESITLHGAWGIYIRRHA